MTWSQTWIVLNNYFQCLVAKLFFFFFDSMPGLHVFTGQWVQCFVTLRKKFFFLEIYLALAVRVLTLVIVSLLYASIILSEISVFLWHTLTFHLVKWCLFCWSMPGCKKSLLVWRWLWTSFSQLLFLYNLSSCQYCCDWSSGFSYCQYLPPHD